MKRARRWAKDVVITSLGLALLGLDPGSASAGLTAATGGLTSERRLDGTGSESAATFSAQAWTLTELRIDAGPAADAPRESEDDDEDDGPIIAPTPLPEPTPPPGPEWRPGPSGRPTDRFGLSGRHQRQELSHATDLQRAAVAVARRR